MSDKIKLVWPERLMIRDTTLYDDIGGAGQRIYTTAGQGYEKREYVRADVAALLSTPPVVEWQPIETAPTEGYMPVLVSDGKYVTLAEWHADEKQWWEINNHPTDSWGRPLYPTHWRRVPAFSPPTSEGAGHEPR